MHSILTEVMQGATPKLDALIDAFGGTFDLLYELIKTPQDAEWHAEGDVHVHTEMVLAETYEQLARHGGHFTPERRLALVLGALLHDIAKPLVTRYEEREGRERIVAPHHADRGRSYLAYKLLELGLPYEVACTVLALVGHHHDPKFLVIKDKAAREYKQLARQADLELLYYLEQADMRGRIASDQAQQIEYIDLFRLFAEEYGLWQVPATRVYEEWRAFMAAELAHYPQKVRDLVLANAIRDFEAGQIFTPHEAIARSYQYRDRFAELVVMCGPSGSGKTSWIEKHLPEYHVVSLDDLREQIAGKRSDQSKNGQVMQAAKEMLKGHLRRHEKVVWDATNIRRQHRNAITQLGFNYHAFVTLVVFHMPEREFFARNRQRPHAIPDQILQRQLDNIEWPYVTDAHRVIFVDEEGEYRPPIPGRI